MSRFSIKLQSFWMQFYMHEGMKNNFLPRQLFEQVVYIVVVTCAMRTANIGGSRFLDRRCGEQWMAQ
jgi:hypothetical protein